MALLTREDILNYNDIKTEIVPVPEWGGEVKVKGLTAAKGTSGKPLYIPPNDTATTSR